MIRIGKLTDYAILILGEMALVPDAILSASSLADLIKLPLPTVSKILKILSEAQLVTSARGAIGGYRLARPAAQITLATVITIMEREIALTECCKMRGTCNLASSCTMQKNWQKINKLVLNLLAQWTILDMRNEHAEFSYGQ